jgi:hypothetical protein
MVYLNHGNDAPEVFSRLFHLYFLTSEKWKIIYHTKKKKKKKNSKTSEISLYTGFASTNKKIGHELLTVGDERWSPYGTCVIPS